VKPPIIALGDEAVARTFSNLDAAASHMEAIDVEDGLYRAVFDSEGLVLIPRPMRHNNVTIVPSDPAEYRPEELRKVLQETVAWICAREGDSSDWIARASKEELLARLQGWEHAMDSRSLGGKFRRLLARMTGSTR
jgi:hypothetical protein